MPLMQDVEWEACCLEPVWDRELERYIRREKGRSLPSTRYFTPCPWMVRSSVHIDFLGGKLAHIPLELAVRIALVVTQNNTCRYCFTGQRLAMRLMGFPEAHTRRLEQDALTADLDPRERAALQFGRRLSRANPPLAPVHFEPVQAAGYSEDAIREIALVAATMDYNNRTSTFPGLPPEGGERLANSRLVRWFALPILGRPVRARWGAGKPDFFARELGEAPFKLLLAGLDGLPMGRGLWRTLDEAWNSDILPRRTKALIFAVVARVLGCPVSQRETASLVAAEGMPRAELESVLANLGGPQLDPIDAQIVPFARETVWYQPAPIQRRVRALQEHLTPPQLLELVGIAALANMVCRLCVVVGER